MVEKICGVYEIVNKVNGKLYIGSSINIQSRWKEHKRFLRNKNHHSPILQRAWNKYGSENFEFIIIELCDKDMVLEREQYYLDLYKSYDKRNGYNISKNSSAPMMGRTFTKEVREKISESVRSLDSSVWARGEDKSNAVFKDEDIIQIKKMIYEGCKIKDIAQQYNVKANTITQIKTGERWSHIKTEYDDLIIQTPKQKLTNENIIEIKKLLAEEELKIVEIAELFNVTFGMISAILRLRNHKDIGAEYNDKLNNRQQVNKLNKNKVIKIKEYIKDGKSDIEIAEIFGVDRTSITYIRNKKTWKEVC